MASTMRLPPTKAEWMRRARVAGSVLVVIVVGYMGYSLGRHQGLELASESFAREAYYAAMVDSLAAACQAAAEAALQAAVWIGP